MFKKFRKDRAKKSQSHNQTSLVSVLATTQTDLDQRQPSTRSALISQPEFTSPLSRGGCEANSPSITQRLPNYTSEAVSLPTGLLQVYQPEVSPAIDVVFIHGLGGDCIKTWSHNRDPANFWPGKWLPVDPKMRQARIFTFGYNASLRPGESRSISNVGDFAKDLLYQLKFSSSEGGEQYGIGDVPIVFVCHSMGGLVVKKAYLLGQHDLTYKHIVSSIQSIVFLSTPHRGSNLAEVLNNMLAVTFQSRKSYLVDLNRGSQTLEDINEQFRNVAPNLSIWSFYETLSTAIGPRKMMILEKESSILGYPGEISKPLHADHHTVCKFTSDKDPNYVAVLNALRAISNDAIRHRLNKPVEEPTGEKLDIRRLFAIADDPADEFLIHSTRMVAGTCGWFFQEAGVVAWLNNPSRSALLIYSAPAASGKSTLSAKTIQHLSASMRSCQYFFFVHNDTKKQSIAAMLRVLAWQIAEDNAEYRKMLLELADGGIRFDKLDASVIWQKLFVDSLFRLQLPKTLFWVIDALDECEAPSKLIDLFRSASASETRIRILITSRNIDCLQTSLSHFSPSVSTRHINKHGSEHNKDDIRMYVEQEIGHVRGDDGLKQEVIQNILDRAEGNFLWARLVLNEIIGCHTRDGIELALKEVPADMNDLYQRIEDAIVHKTHSSHKMLAKAILQWTITAQRPLSITELSHALAPDHTGILDMKRTVLDICGQLIHIDTTDLVRIVHQTAREYLIRPRDSFLFIDAKLAHFELFKKTILVLSEPRQSMRVRQSHQIVHKADPLLSYAAASWAFHLEHSENISDDCVDMLVRFFTTHCVLSWIKLLALADRLDVVIRASRVLSTFIANRRRSNTSQNLPPPRIADLEVLGLWALDMIEIVGKFSHRLIDEPDSIYEVVPAFCPESSITHRQFGNSHTSIVKVLGLEHESWTDSLVRLTLSDGMQPVAIAAAGDQLAVLQSEGAIYLWDTRDFRESNTMHHGEPVTCLCVNQSGNRLATYGLQATKVWDLSSGKLLFATESCTDTRAMTITFIDKDTRLVGGFADSSIRSLRLNTSSGKWTMKDQSLRLIPTTDGALYKLPYRIAFNHDGSLVGMAYRNSPLTIWQIEDGRCINTLRRIHKASTHGQWPSISWFDVNRIAWNPITDHVIGLYKDGCIFKWYPYADENDEASIQADEIAISPSGKVFLTSSTSGTITLWDFQHFSMMYRLSSDDLVNALTFSPDSSRFYDIRTGDNSTINAWEPHALISSSDMGDDAGNLTSDIQSMKSLSCASYAHLIRADRVTALSISDGWKLFAYGSEDGVIQLRSMSAKAPFKLAQFPNFMDVSLLSWSSDGSHLASTDLAGDVMLHRLPEPIAGREVPDASSTTQLASPKLDLQQRGVNTILWSMDQQSVLIVSGETVNVWSIPNNAISISARFENDIPRQWLNHPIQSNLILAFGPADVRTFRWADLVEPCSRRVYQGPLLQESIAVNIIPVSASSESKMMDSSDVTSRKGSSMFITKVFITHDREYIVVQTSRRLQNTAHAQTRSNYMIFASSSFDFQDTSGSTEDLAVPYHQIPFDVAERIYKLLDIRPGRFIVFLDRDLWVCTFQLRYDSMRGNVARPSAADAYPPELRLQDLALQKNSIRRMYFIPRDWFEKRSLEQCCMLSDGTLLYPKADKVAIIKADFNRAR